MALDHSLVGVPGEPQERSWTSKDALLYAVGVGAGLGDPLHELEFTTENSEGVTQQVLPTYGGADVPGERTGRSLGDFDRALLVHAEQSFELHQPLPVEGTVRTVATVTGIYDKGSGALVVTESKAVDAATGEPLVTARSSTFIRGEGGFGGDRGPSDTWAQPDRAPRPQGDPADPAGAGPAVPAVRRPEPAARRPEVRRPGRLRPADPARPVHLRRHRPGPAARAVRLGPGPVRVHVGPVQPSGPAWRVAGGLDLGGR